MWAEQERRKLDAVHAANERLEKENYTLAQLQKKARRVCVARPRQRGGFFEQFARAGRRDNEYPPFPPSPFPSAP